LPWHKSSKANGIFTVHFNKLSTDSFFQDLFEVFVTGSQNMSNRQHDIQNYQLFAIKMHR